MNRKQKRTKEKGAKGVKGYLLYDPFKKNHFFRVHNKKDPAKFKDYKITAEDIEIKLLSNFNCLVELENGDKILDYSSEVLGYK
jgi:hypothetical protein